MKEQKKHITEGEFRVRVNFNPGGNEEVEDLKRQAARLIDMIYCAGKEARCRELAMNAFEEGAMWAVKSLTLDN